MSVESDPLEARRLRLERDLYRGLLNLDDAPQPEQFLERALSLVVEIVGAKRGYLELSDIEKSYGGLRPLRIERLALGPADQVAILGIDRPGAEEHLHHGGLGSVVATARWAPEGTARIPRSSRMTPTM